MSSDDIIRERTNRFLTYNSKKNKIDLSLQEDLNKELSPIKAKINLTEQAEHIHSIVNLNQSPFQRNIRSLLKTFRRKAEFNHTQILENKKVKKNFQEKENDEKNRSNFKSISEDLISKDLIKNSNLNQKTDKSDEIPLFHYNRYNKKKSKKTIVDKSERGLIKFNNVYDSFSDEEREEIISNFTNLQFSQNSVFLKFWGYFVVILIFFSCAYTPYNLSFYKINPNFIVNEIFIEVFFMLDVVFNFLTTIKGENDNLVINMTHIAIYYITTDFPVDLLAAFPHQLINLLLGTSSIGINDKKNSFINSVSLMSWLCFFRLIKIQKYKFLQDAEIFKNSKFNRLFKSIVLFIFIIHFTSCFWIYLGYLNQWKTSNWLFQFISISYQSFDIYICSIYFHLVTIYSIGYGDIVPLNTSERIYCNVLLFFGIMLFTYALTSISSIFINQDEFFKNYLKRKNILGDLEYDYFINNELKKNIESQLVLIYRNEISNRKQFLDSLPRILRNELIVQMYEKKISNLKFFKNQSSDFVLEVLPLLKTHYLKKNQILFSEGEVVEEMHIVIRGSLSIRLGEKYGRFELGTVQKFSHFGDIFLQVNENSLYELSSKSRFTEVLVLKKIDFMKIKNENLKNIVKILKDSYPTLEYIEKRRKLFMKLNEIYNSPKIVRNIIKKINMYLMNKDFDRYYFDNEDFEDANDFIFNNDLNVVLNLLNTDYFKVKNQPPTKYKKIEKDKQEKENDILFKTIKMIEIKDFEENEKNDLNYNDSKLMLFEQKNKPNNKYEEIKVNSNESLFYERNQFSPVNSFKQTNLVLKHGITDNEKIKRNKNDLTRTFNVKKLKTQKSKINKKMTLIEKYKLKILSDQNKDLLKEESDLNSMTYKLIHNEKNNINTNNPNATLKDQIEDVENRKTENKELTGRVKITCRDNFNLSINQNFYDFSILKSMNEEELKIIFDKLNQHNFSKKKSSFGSNFQEFTIENPSNINIISTQKYFSNLLVTKNCGFSLSNQLKSVRQEYHNSEEEELESFKEEDMFSTIFKKKKKVSNDKFKKSSMITENSKSEDPKTGQKLYKKLDSLLELLEITFPHN